MPRSLVSTEVRFRAQEFLTLPAHCPPWLGAIEERVASTLEF
jgi:hypothetical protein